jgi:hypothetical protein
MWIIYTRLMIWIEKLKTLKRLKTIKSKIKAINIFDMILKLIYDITDFSQFGWNIWTFSPIRKPQDLCKKCRKIPVNKVWKRKLKTFSRGITLKKDSSYQDQIWNWFNSTMYPYIKFEWNVYNHCRDNERKLKISIFFQSSRGTKLCKKSTDHNEIRTWPEYIFLWRTYTCNFNLIHTYKQKLREWKLKISSRGITLSKNHQTMTKFELDLHNPMMYPYSKFELNMCNCSRDNVRKPMIMEWPKSKWTAVI